MTGGVPAPFALREDVTGRFWRPLAPDEGARVDLRLGDASSLLRSVVPDLDARIAADESGQLARTAAFRVADVVIRALDNPRGAKSVSETMGNRTYSVTLAEAPGTGLFITDVDLVGLIPGMIGEDVPMVGSTFVSTTPEWSGTWSGGRRRSW